MKSGGFRAVAETVPDFAFFVFFAAEQDGVRRFSANEHHYGFGFRKTREVPEVAVETVRMMRIAIAYALGGRREDGDAVTDFGKERGAAG